jgi:pyruvate dehydrogenase E2 component (dihydrolipoamide acetyltransferase)
MERSWRTIPHYHVTSVIDVTDLGERLATRNGEVADAERMLLAAPLHTAIARATAEVPACNGWWQAGAFVAADRVDLGVVVALRTGGIVVPTIPEADQLDADAMMIQLRDVVERARRGRLRGSDLTPASITVTSLGERGARSVSGVIHPPQVALIGIGSVHDEATVVDGDVRPGRVVHLTVAGDHRAHDGLAAARLLTAVERHLEELP